MANKERDTLYQMLIEGNDYHGKYKNFNFCVLRHDPLAHLCGYVEIPKGHKLHGKTIDDLDYLFVHGGQKMNDNLALSGFALTSWCIGFAAFEYHDYCPRFRTSKSEESTYKDMSYMVHQCRELISQVVSKE